MILNEIGLVIYFGMYPKIRIFDEIFKSSH